MTTLDQIRKLLRERWPFHQAGNDPQVLLQQGYQHHRETVRVIAEILQIEHSDEEKDVESSQR